MNQTEQIRQFIVSMLLEAKKQGKEYCDIRAGDIKKSMNLGNIPKSICDAMRTLPWFTQYEVTASPPSGNSTSVEYRYVLKNIDVTALDTNTNNIKDKTSVQYNKFQLNIDNFHIGKLLANALTFHRQVIEIENHRYRSWEYCYSFFSKYPNTEDPYIIDLMCLHLSNYLASWGMFRGSAFLLQKDYKVHLDVVKLMLSDKYQIIKVTDVRKIINENEYIEKIFELAEEISEIYRMKTVDLGNEQGRNATETLITKILLGVFGCVPAYDRYFKSGIQKVGVASNRFSDRSLRQIIEFYNKYYEEFENMRCQINRHGIEYTPMKIIDMCFWQIGYEESIKKRINKRVLDIKN